MEGERNHLRLKVLAVFLLWVVGCGALRVPAGRAAGPVEAVVASVQSALDVACAAREVRPLEGGGAYRPVQPIGTWELGHRAEEFCHLLRDRHHAVLRVEGLGALGLLDVADSVVGSRDSLNALGAARAVRPGEFVGVFESDQSTFVEFRYATRDRAPMPRIVDNPHAARAFDDARLKLSGAGAVALSAIDPRYRAYLDDTSCVSSESPQPADVASTTAHRICLYHPSGDAAWAFGAHTDTTFFTMIPFAKTPGLEVFDPSLGAWVCPEEAAAAQHHNHLASDDRVLVLPGELLELASAGDYRSAVHRVVTTPTRRVSAPLLLRGARHATIRGVPMAAAWAALQATSVEAASEMLVTSAGEPPAARRHLVPKRTTAEVKAFARLVAGPNVRVLSLEPLLLAMDDFATKEECDEVLAQALAEDKQGFVHSEVLSPTKGTADQQVVEPNFRTSSTKWLDDEVVPAALTRRAEALAGFPTDHAERWQVARYAESQQYTVHTDTLDSFNDLAPSGRVSTLLVYLDDAFEGGTTYFPALHVDFRPKKGTAIFFHNVKVPLLDAYATQTDFRAAHAGTPLKSGRKHILTKWFHPVPFPDGPDAALGEEAPAPDHGDER